MSSRREKNKPRNSINKQLEPTEVPEKEKNDNLIQLGKFFYSLAGMTYAGVILSAIIDYDDDKVGTIVYGSLATVLLAVLAWHFVKFGNIKK